MRTYLITKPFECDLLELYCNNKPWWWRLFFGWRGTMNRGNFNWWYYRIPKKVYNNVKELSEKYCGD